MIIILSLFVVSFSDFPKQLIEKPFLSVFFGVGGKIRRKIFMFIEEEIQFAREDEKLEISETKNFYLKEQN